MLLPHPSSLKPYPIILSFARVTIRGVTICSRLTILGVFVFFLSLPYFTLGQCVVVIWIYFSYLFIWNYDMHSSDSSTSTPPATDFRRCSCGRRMSSHIYVYVLFPIMGCLVSNVLDSWPDIFWHFYVYNRLSTRVSMAEYELVLAATIPVIVSTCVPALMLMTLLFMWITIRSFPCPADPPVSGAPLGYYTLAGYIKICPYICKFVCTYVRLYMSQQRHRSTDFIS